MKTLKKMNQILDKPVPFKMIPNNFQLNTINHYMKSIDIKSKLIEQQTELIKY